ncbi:hypothetical protein AKJ09_03174 [Labilithrix luteola]|uniref:Type IV fimbrial biogenesis protein PilY1 n=1 Tax=Labilithrix luteola TaxID=1391654 RepID=A0A0K1PSJ3_9BACT|nr:hypothetical protein [Labilithrix luteola]AKU96510.1 hypothetical protein AKJ09_03174 [Labilithrix luteola]
MNERFLGRLSLGALATMLASGAVAAMIGCSNGTTDTDVQLDAPDVESPDASDATRPQEDADADADAGQADAQADADAGDAEPRTCSDDFVCHTQLPPKSFLRDVWSAGDGVVWAVGWADPILSASKGSILRWDGKTWTKVFEEANRLHAIWGSSPTDIWVGGDNGLFHGTGPSSDALTWTKVRSEVISSIWGTSESDVWAVGSTKTYITMFDGKVLHYQGPAQDGSDGWELDPISTGTVGFRKVWGSGPNDVWIAGQYDRGCSIFCIQEAVVYHRVAGENGPTWSQAGMPSFGYNGLRGSVFSGGGSIGPNNVWLFGSTVPEIYSSQDGRFMGVAKNDGSGEFAWTPGTFGTCEGYWYCKNVWFTRAVWGTKPDDVFLAGDYGQVRHWDGRQFTFVKTTLEFIPSTASLYAMWGSSNTDLWIVGDGIALHKLSPSTH